MSYKIRPSQSKPQKWIVFDDDGERTSPLVAHAVTESDAMMIAASLNMMVARNSKGTPWEVMVAVQADVINAAEVIFDAILESNPFGAINRQCKYCQIIWGVGSALLQKAGIDDEVRKADTNEAIHRPTCLISAAGEWKLASADRVEEAIRRTGKE